MHEQDPHGRLREFVGQLIQQKGADSSLLDNLPKRWEKFADVALLPRTAFTEEGWNDLRGPELWSAIASALKVNRIGKIGEIIGEKRESTVELLRGEDDWVIRRENGIDYGYNFTQCMFSAGNINERRRMGEVGGVEETVVDLFSGIGYYTLPMLVNSQVNHVHCCEWNPNAIRALKWSLDRNNVANKCTIHEGDNRLTAPNLSGQSDRVILGLLPTAEGGFELAINCLKKIGGCLHIHGIAPASDHDSWVDEIITKLSNLNHDFSISESSRVRIKSHAPHWDHLVLDVDLSPRA
jgi:tRNA wybutosine-synthesizing protein 2